MLPELSGTLLASEQLTGGARLARRGGAWYNRTMQTSRVTVTVDVAAEPEKLDAALVEVSDVAGVSATWEIIKERGPGGGWPEVDVTFSDREAGKVWLTVFCGGDAEQADEILSM